MEFDEDEEISEYHYDAGDVMSLDTVSNAEDGGLKRGPKKIPELWTRVISISYDRIDQLKSYSVSSELLLAAGFPEPEKKKWARKYKLLFNPKEFVKEFKDITLDGFRLNQKELEEYGLQVSKIRT